MARKPELVSKDELLAELRKALQASVRLQSHYAQLLNSYDGGKRIIFNTVEEWIARLRKIGDL